MTAEQITIAVTVFDRRAYIEQAVASALGQTRPVRVFVVDDCGPDAGLQALVLSKFGSRVTYHRNPRRRGLFDNWNACLEWCATPWLCLLHDDDYLEPSFIEAMLEVSTELPGKGLYFGKCQAVTAEGYPLDLPLASDRLRCWPLDVRQAALANPVAFPGELFRADYVKALGGFHRTSFFTGDWDMWMKLALHHGAAGTSRIVGYTREHQTDGRGTVRVLRNGKARAFIAVQVKKNMARLRQQGLPAVYHRSALLTQSPVAVRALLENANGYSPRMLAYNVGLLQRSPSPFVRDWLFRALARCLGPSFVGVASRWYHSLKRFSRP